MKNALEISLLTIRSIEKRLLAAYFSLCTLTYESRRFTILQLAHRGYSRTPEKFSYSHWLDSDKENDPVV